MNDEKAVRFARWVFLLAGVGGVVEIVPLYFLEASLGRSQPPPITHPEFYYGFVGRKLVKSVMRSLVSKYTLRLHAMPQLPDLNAGPLRSWR